VDIRNFLDEVCSQIKYKPVRNEISEEIKTHIEEIKLDYINNGMNEKDAEQKAVNQMGKAEEIGKRLNKIHRPKLDWKLLVLLIILIGFEIYIVVLKGPTIDELKYIIFYTIAGIMLSFAIYFFDYRKIKSYSNLVYTIATIIMIWPMSIWGIQLQGIMCIEVFGIIFRPFIISIPLYIIAFIGYMLEDKKDKIKIYFEDKRICISKSNIKFFILSVISIILVLSNSIANGVILFIIYLTIYTVKILEDKENRIKKLSVVYGSTLIFVATFIFLISLSPFRLNRIIASFNPESDPEGLGYTGMLQKEILESAKWIGEADTEIISNYKYFIISESNYTFIYLLGKAGIIIASSLVLAIILTGVKLIFNAKNIKEEYGRLLIIGLGTLYILQSIVSILMNINLGLKVSVDLPFVSCGGVYFIVNILSIGVIFSVYRRKNINMYEKCK